VLENRGQGGAFEGEVLKAKGCEKNTALMLPPPGSKAEQGFVPDSVLGNPEELVWGKPYRFVEVKGRAEMALTGNLKAMIEYVKRYGGHIEVWFRSASHPSGKTLLTGPLRTATTPATPASVSGRVSLGGAHTLWSLGPAEAACPGAH
jgi:hypothetical protein